MKRKTILLFILCALMIWIGAGCAQEPKQKMMDESAKIADVGYEINNLDEKTAGIESGDNDIMKAGAILFNAFSYDVGNIAPEITHENTQGHESVTFTFFPSENDPSDSYIVTLADGIPYPVTAYHFGHSNADEQVNIEVDSDFSFNADMIEIAKDFVKKVCDVDCSSADSSAYGYGNKICAVLTVSEEQIFLISFYYKDINPVGVRFASDSAMVGRTMEIQKARLLYTQDE